MSKQTILDCAASPTKEKIFSDIAAIICSTEDSQKELVSYLSGNYSSFSDLLCSSSSDWKKLPSGAGSLPVLCAVVKELAHRYSRSLLPEGDLLKHPELLYNYLMIQMARERIEQFRLLFLDKKHHLILDEIQSHGTINHAPVYPREVAKRCIELQAAGLIMVHNHPSGQVMPSKGDVIITQTMENALRVVEVTVVDHLIVTRKSLTSFRQLGLLSEE